MNIKGSTIVLIKNGLVVAALVTQDVSASAERIGTAGATQGQWTEAITGQRNWEVNATWLLNNGGLLTDDMLQVGETFVLKIANRSMPDDAVFGLARLKQCSVKGVVGNIVTGTFKFDGSDELNMYAGSDGDFNYDFNNDFFI